MFKQVLDRSQPPVMFRNRKYTIFATVVAILLCMVYWRQVRESRVPIDDLEDEYKFDGPADPKLGLNLMMKYGIKNLKYDVDYTTIHMNVREVDGTPPLKQNLGVPLPLPLAEDDPNSTLISSPVTVDVPVATIEHPVDASSVLFGISTSMAKLKSAIPAMSYWISGTGAQLIAEIVESDINDPRQPTLESIMKLAQEHNVPITILKSSLNVEERYVLLHNLLYNYRTEKTKWVGLIDDDTFFPSMPRVLKMLSKYDSEKPHYISGLVENGKKYMPWEPFRLGNAGIFISLPLLHDLQPFLQDCANIDKYGDRAVATCIYKHTSHTLTIDPDLHQVDIQGDQSGFYEAIQELPLSVHYNTNWAGYDMGKMAQVSWICGPRCFLHKYYFTNDWMLTNGFSIVQYSDLRLKFTEPYPVEKTWQGSSFWSRLGRIVEKDRKKIQYLFEASIRDDKKGTVTQFYVRRVGKKGVGVIRLVWSR